MKKRKLYLLGLFALFIGNCAPPTPIEDSELATKLATKTAYERNNDKISWAGSIPSDPPLDSDGQTDGDLNDDGIKDWGQGINIDYDFNDDGTLDWGNGMHLPSNEPPFDSDGLIDYDLNDDGTQDWGNGMHIPSNEPPLDSDGLIDYDLNDDGTQDWGNGINLPSRTPIDADGIRDGDFTDDGTQDWGDGINLSSRTLIDADGIRDGDFTDDGTQDWGDGVNIDYDLNDDGTQDWGNGMHLQSDEPPLDSDGQIDGDFTDDGIQDWGDGINIPSRIPIDADGETDGDFTDDGTQDWGQGINIDYDLDHDGTKDWGHGVNIDKDINEDGIQDWGDGVNIGNNLDSDNNGYIDPVPLDPTFRDPNDPYQNWNLGKTGYISLKNDSLGTTYDFSGLGMDPNDYNQVSLISRYYYTNQFNARQHLNVVHSLATTLPSESTLWKGYYNGNYIYTAQDIDESKYIHTIPPEAWVFDATPINSYCGEYTYYHEPLTGANGGNKTKYTFKGINNGTGKVEIVGFIVFKNGIIVDQRGDNTHRPPYLPTGYGPPAIGP